MRFSERIGGRPPRTSGPLEASEALRVVTWNALSELLMPIGSTSEWNVYQANAKLIWNHIPWTIDTVPHYAVEGRARLKDYWLTCPYLDFFDIYEFAVVTLVRESRTPSKWYDRMNAILIDQGCAYRFVSQTLAPLTNPIELAEVSNASECAIPPVASHIRSALSLLPPSKDASPRNSMKESISAVEGALKHFTGEASADLNGGLRAFEDKYGKLHGALHDALVKLYGYTSDQKGVRHALVDGTAEPTVDDAKFMLVVCSAFANYLVALSSGPRRNASVAAIR